MKPINSFFMAGLYSFFITLFSCSSAKEKNIGVTMCGALELHTLVEEKVSWDWFTNGGGSRSKTSTSYFNVTYKGKPVLLSGQKKENYFWQALILKDAPKPTILAATQSMYLISDDNGTAKIRSVNERNDNFGKFQWLDSENGNPGKQNEVYVQNISASSRILEGGRYLLINTSVILDVHTLKSYKVDINSSERVDALDDYNPFDSRAVGFSPDKTQIVYIGYRRNPVTSISEYALVCIDFLTDKAYAIPFDRTDTHFYSIWDATNSWVETYFNWSLDQDGKAVLSLNKFRQLPYWQGRLGLEVPTGKAKNYKLIPVQKSMINSFMDFIMQKNSVSNLKSEEVSTQIINSFKIDSTDLVLYYNSTDKHLTLESDNKELIKKIGKEFDSELNKGKFQNDFARFNFD